MKAKQQPILTLQDGNFYSWFRYVYRNVKAGRMVTEARVETVMELNEQKMKVVAGWVWKDVG